jgi:hypothetical protein
LAFDRPGGFLWSPQSWQKQSFFWRKKAGRACLGVDTWLTGAPCCAGPERLGKGQIHPKRRKNAQTLLAKELVMAKSLSEQLADLSVRAKNAEDALAAAKKEGHDKIAARKEQARAAATTAVEKVNRDITSAGDSAARNWNTVKAKIEADITALKTRVARTEHDRDVKRAEKHAEHLEWEASFAVDYAIASVEQAKLAVLDAVEGRVEAEQAKA